MPDLCFDLLERNRLVSTVLDLYIDCARLMFRLRSTYGSTLSTENVCFYFVDLCFKFLDRNRVYFECRPIFWLSRPKYCLFRLYAWVKFRSFRPKLGRFRLSEPMFWLSPTKSGMFRLCARLKIASRPRICSRKTAIARLSKSKLKSGSSTRELKRCPLCLG